MTVFPSLRQTMASWPLPKRSPYSLLNVFVVFSVQIPRSRAYSSISCSCRSFLSSCVSSAETFLPTSKTASTRGLPPFAMPRCSACENRSNTAVPSSICFPYSSKRDKVTSSTTPDASFLSKSFLTASESLLALLTTSGCSGVNLLIPSCSDLYKSLGLKIK